ncbi:gliding motility-associated-like protein [Mucilaginibacter yixingensis]|uniref:Gliding motility-associated-like protein n=1 Tax=Mucilaginibacter yixingensis TaxID=1295612 RepID=A0A2T5JCP0_9SPHI|nr:gliding motility-associated C-terminal domain-containing protein [Mucilaginibacter yixingensis]PTQ99530.1 gliding motility-associated-like protein [Mucilaginibacter yixingensis]
MKISTSGLISRFLFLAFLILQSSIVFGQRTYGSSTNTGATGFLCLGCTVSNASNAADGNPQTYATLNVTLGLAASTYEDVIFPGKVASGTQVSVKLGTGDNLLSVTALGGVSLQAYNGTTAVGSPVLASDLVSVLANNNQLIVSFTPTAQYDRVRVTLNGGLAGALSSFYVYDAFYNGTGNVACNTAVDELHGISSGLLSLGASVGGVVNPQQAIDGNVNTASTLNAGIAAVGAYAQQTIIFQNQSVVGDSVRLYFSLPSSLITLGVTANISVSTYNGNTSNNDTQTFNSSLISLRLLDAASSKYSVTFAPSAVFDRVQVRLGGGIAGVLSTMNLYEAQRVIPRPVVRFNNVIASTVQTCAGSSVTLTVDNVPNTTFNWYTAATGGSPVFTGTSYTVGPLNANAVYYVEAVRNGCTDASDRTPVTINVNQIPAAPVVANNAVTVCSGQTATFTATSVPGVTVNWYNAATGGTLVGTGNTFTTTALAANATYYAEAVSGGTCVSTSRTQVTATISVLPSAPALTAPNVTICDGDVAVFAISSPDANLTYNWYSAATGGSPLYTGVNYTTSPLHSNAIYYVEAVNANGCASSARTQANVTVQPKPADPTLLANNSSISAGQTTTINVSNAQTGVTYNWYASSTGATPIFTGTTYTTPALYAPTTYYVSAVNSTGCTSVNRTAITINVTINTNAPCSFANAQTNAVGGVACLLCSVNNPALAVDADTTTASTLRVTVGLAAYTQQTVQFQNAGFAGDTVKLSLGSPVGLADVSVLGGVSVTFYNGATAGATYQLNNSLIKLNLLSGNKFIALVKATADYDRVVIRLDPTVTALTSLDVYYVAQQFPTPIFNPVAPEVCKGSKAVINITSPTNGTLTWYDAPTSGTLVNTGTTYTTPNLNANTTYYIVYTRNGCTNGVRYPVTVVVDDVPVKPTAGLSNVTIYAGQTATLTATPPTGAVVNWYDAATNGNKVGGPGNTFTTPVLNANTTYYAESTLGNCVSVDRTPVTVTVLPVVIPDVTVVPPTQTINAGETTSFTASSTTPGAVFNWFTTPTGGSSIFTGPNFTTPAQFANTIYYAEASIPATGAKSATRATGTVNVNNSASSPVPCDAAIDQTTANSGILCVACGVNNATGSVDGDRNTFSQLSVPVGLGLSQYQQQTLRFASTGRAGDSVVVELGVPASLLDLTLLSNISLATYNGATYNNDRFQVNSSLLTLNLLSGVNRFRVVFKATADFDRVEIRLNSVLSALNALNIYDAYQEVAAPTVTATSVTACEGTQATLTATAPDYVTVKWYSSATGGTPLFTGKVYTTAALTAGTYTYYAEASRTADGCAQSVRTKVTVTVNPTPANPVVSVPTVTICSGQTATFAATPVSGVTFNWYDAATGGNLVHTGNNFTTAALTANAVYYVEAANGTCVSASRTQVTANVTTAVADPSVVQNAVQTCSGSTATLTASSTQPGVTFKWYTQATGGSAVFTGAQFTTPTLTSNTTYYVEASTGTCTSTNRASATVTVNPTPVAPTVTVVPASQQITSGQTATLTASSTTAGATFNWYNSATGGTPIFTGAVFTTPALTATTTYYVESALATGCISPTRTPVTITVNPVFSTSCDFASSQTFSVGVACVACSVTNPNNAVDADTTTYSQFNVVVALGSISQKLIFADQGSAGDTVRIKVALPSGVISAGLLSSLTVQSFLGAAGNADQITLNSSLIKIQLLSGGTAAIIKFVPGANYDAVQLSIDATLSALTNLNVYYATKQVEAPVLATNTANICGGGSATFTVSNARNSVITYDWYDAAVGGNLVHTGSSYTATGLTASTTFYVQSRRTSNGCINANRVPATVNVTPTPPVPVLAANTVTVCAGNPVTLSVTNAGTATINWYDAATGGNLVHTGAVYAFTPVANGNYFAEATNGSCTSSARTQATVTVTPRPSNPSVVSANVQVCAGTTATLQVQTPEAGVTYNWYATSTSTTVLGSGTSFTTGAITANTTFYVGATSNTGGCDNTGGRTVVNVTTGGTIAAPTLSATATQVCAGGSATVSVVNPVAGLTYNWYTTPTGTTLAFSGTSFTLNNVTLSAKYYVEAANASGCVSATRTETDINVQAPPTPPQVQAGAGGTNVCAGSSASLSILNPDASLVYRWYNAATNGTILYTGTQFNTPALTANATYYVEAAAAGNCNPSTRTKVDITVTTLPNSPALVSSSLVICQGSTATLQISNPQNGITYQWFNSPAQTTKLFEGTTYVTGPINASTMFYVAAVNGNGCRSNSLGTAQVNVQSAPGAPVLTNNAVSTCANSQAVLSINNPQTGFTYNWYNTATGGTALASGNSFTTPVLTANATFYAEAVNSTGCISGTRSVANVTVNPAPANPVVTAVGGSTSPSICANSTITLNATSTTANVTFNWYNVATGGSPIATGASYTTGPLTTATTIYAEAVANGTGCVSAARTGITINVSAPPATPTPVAATINTCNGSTATLAVSSPVGGVIYHWYDASKTTVLATGPTYTTGPITANATYYVDATSGSCTSPSLASVQVTVVAIPGAPVLTSNAVNNCSGSQATLSVASPQTGYTYNWYAAATGGSALNSGTTFMTPALTANTTYYAEAVNSNGCPSATRTAVAVNVLPVPPTPGVATTGTDICAGATTTLAVNSPDATLTYRWYTTANGGTAAGTGATFTTPALNANTTYYVEAGNAGGCVSATRGTVTVQVRQPLAQPVVSVANATNNSVTFQWAAVPGAASYQISLDNGSTFSSPSSGAAGTTHTVTGLQPNQAVTIVVKAFGSLACQMSALSDAVTGRSLNPFGDGLYIPNAFSPNGDGKNDIFQVYGTNVKSVTIWVYNQWGSLMLQTTNNATGWDGTYKGTPQPVGVYVYYVEAIMNDAQKVTKKGTVTLLR